MKYTAIIDGRRLEIQLTRSNDGMVEAEIGGERYCLDVDSVEPGVYWIRLNNRSIEVSVTPNGEAYVVSMAGRNTKVEILDARAELRRAGHQAQAGKVELRAPMPGKVVRVLVSEGAEVEANQGLLVIEAMKMQNEIKSPKKGIVRRVAATEAGAVNAGDLLVVVE
jgi:biotin carboxyl carrier protein